VRQHSFSSTAFVCGPEIIIGEVRGDEAFDMLQAMNTARGFDDHHPCHTPATLFQLESMVAMASVNMPRSSPADCVRIQSSCRSRMERWHPQVVNIRDYRSRKRRQHAIFSTLSGKASGRMEGCGFVSATGIRPSSSTVTCGGILCDGDL